MSFGCAALLTVERFGPKGARDGERRPFDEGLSQEGGAAPAPVDPTGVTAVFRAQDRLYRRS